MPALTWADMRDISFAVLFCILFFYTLKTNEKREARYLTLLDCYGEQLKGIAATLKLIQEQTAHLVKARGHEED